MKFLVFIMCAPPKAVGIARVADKAMREAPPGVKMLATYACQGVLPLPGTMENSQVTTVSVVEVETNEDLSAVLWPIAVAGALIYTLPVQDMPVPGLEKAEKGFRG